MHINSLFSIIKQLLNDLEITKKIIYKKEEFIFEHFYPHEWEELFC